MRLRYTRFFPRPEEAPGYISELMPVLFEADSEIVAAGVIDEWLREQQERPTVAELRAAVERHNAVLRASRTEGLPECNTCGGTGQRVDERMYRGETMSCARRCEACGGSGRASTKKAEARV